jgi:hypothetical protein
VPAAKLKPQASQNAPGDLATPHCGHTLPLPEETDPRTVGDGADAVAGPAADASAAAGEDGAAGSGDAAAVAMRMPQTSQ